MAKRPTVRRITSHTQPVTIDGQTRIARVWVGRGEVVAEDPDDWTLPEITHKYLTKRALVKAIEDGSAFLSTENEDSDG